ncbi:hypothetical protein cypCar_00023141 [Cyprinus carpio]|nr:hypothetical protein cypCar_00023141 [Cyprinus carpio]
MLVDADNKGVYSCVVLQFDWAYPMRREMQTKEFIDGCLETGGNECFSILISVFNIKCSTFSVLILGKVLVHGNAGISRSAALVIAYLMETFGVKYRDAFSHVQERRFCINPNVGFVHQLQEYEAIYLAKLTIKMMSPIQLGRSFSIQAGMPGKRTFFYGQTVSL